MCARLCSRIVPVAHARTHTRTHTHTHAHTHIGKQAGPLPMTLCLFPQGCDFQGLKMSGTDFSKASGVGATFSFATLLGFQESEKQGRDVAEMQPRCGTDAAQMRHRCGTDAAQMRHRCGTDAAQMRHRCPSAADAAVRLARDAHAVLARASGVWPHHSCVSRSVPGLTLRTPRQARESNLRGAMFERTEAQKSKFDFADMSDSMCIGAHPSLRIRATHPQQTHVPVTPPTRPRHVPVMSPSCAPDTRHVPDTSCPTPRRGAIPRCEVHPRLGANFRDASMEGVTLTNAKLADAHLDGAVLTKALRSPSPSPSSHLTTAHLTPPRGNSSRGV